MRSTEGATGAAPPTAPPAAVVARVAAAVAVAVAVGALVACTPSRREAPGDLSGQTRGSAPSATAPRAPAVDAAPGGRAPAGVAMPTPASAAVVLPRPQANRDLAALKRQVADRIVAANPTRAHTGPIREPLLAIPVLEIELERDGAVRRIAVLRQPKQAADTTAIAIDAVRRAAPFGDVSALRRPWVFAETFLFGDDRTFKVRTHHE